MSQQEYEFWFGGTSMTRARREGLRRNALIAMAVTDDPHLERVLTVMEKDPDPVLRDTVATVRRRAESTGRPPAELG